MVEGVLETFGQIDILVNNAGIAYNTPAEETPDDEWLNVMNINLNGVFYCCRAVGAAHVGAATGRDCQHRLDVRRHLECAAAAGALQRLGKRGSSCSPSRSRGSGRSGGVRVNAVSPGYIGTEMTQRGMENSEWYKTWLEMTPMNRVGEPVEIANAVWYLASRRLELRDRGRT